MITYFVKFVLTFAIVAGSYGFAVPMLVSSTASNLLVLAGFFLAIATPLLLYLLWSDDIATLIKSAKELGVEAPVETKGTKKKSSAKA